MGERLPLQSLCRNRDTFFKREVPRFTAVNCASCATQRPKTAPEGIVRLVERFDRQRDAYRSGDYNEGARDAIFWTCFSRSSLPLPVALRGIR